MLLGRSARRVAFSALRKEFGTIRILLADDNESDRMLEKAMFAKLGLTDVNVAEDGALARAFPGRLPPKP